MWRRAIKVFSLALIATFVVAWLMWQPHAGQLWLVKQNDRPEIYFAVVVPAATEKGPLAHYTEHLAWLPNIGKNSRPEDLDSNVWTNDYAVGYWLSGPPEDLPDMLRHQEVNYTGALRVLDAIIPSMLERGAGHISLVSSVAGFRGLPQSLAYGPTKAALINLAETLYLDRKSVV